MGGYGGNRDCDIRGIGSWGLSGRQRNDRGAFRGDERSERLGRARDGDCGASGRDGLRSDDIVRG